MDNTIAETPCSFITLHKVFTLSQNITDSKGSVLIVIFFTLLTFGTVGLKSILKFFMSHIPENFAIANLLLIYNYLIVIMGMLSLSSTRMTKKQASTIIGRTIALAPQILASLLTYYEWVFFPIRMTYSGMMVLQSMVSRDQVFVYEGVLLIIYAFLFFIDLFITFAILQVKLYFGRKPIPGKDFFAAGKNTSEHLFFGLAPFLVIIAQALLMNDELEINDTIVVFMHIILFAGFAAIVIVYFSEMPYYNKTAELIFGHGLVTFICFVTTIKLSTVRYERRMMLYLLFLPIQIASINFLIELRYKVNYFKKNKISPAYIDIKRIATGRRANQPEDELMRESGFLKLHTSSCKKITCKCKTVWDKIEILKRARLELCETEIHRHDEELQHLTEGNGRITQEEVDYLIQDVDYEIEKLIFDNFTNVDKGLKIWMIYLKLYWVLKERMIPNQIFDLLRQLKRHSQDVKESFTYYQAQKDVEKTLAKIYFKGKLFLPGMTFSEENRLKVEEELNNIDQDGVNFGYAFDYKKNIASLVKRIVDFVDLNNRYISLIEKGATIGAVNELSGKLLDLRNIIADEFEEFHPYTQDTEYMHMAPYFTFCLDCVNMHKSSGELLKLYKKRVRNRLNKSIFQSKKIVESNIFDNTLIFLVESHKSELGKIIDFYGNSKLIKTNPDSIKNLTISSFILDGHKKAHEESMNTFVSNPVSSLLGEQIHRVIKTPGTNYFFLCTFIIKIVPFAHLGFRYVVGVKIHLNDSTNYMIVNTDLKVEGYSYSMKHSIPDAENYLSSGVSIEDFSEKVFKAMKSKHFVLPRDTTIGNVMNYRRGASNAQNNRRKTNLEPSKESYGEVGAEDNPKKRIQSQLHFVNPYDKKSISYDYIVEIEKKSFILNDHSYFMIKLIKTEIEQIAVYDDDGVLERSEPENEDQSHELSSYSDSLGAPSKAIFEVGKKLETKDEKIEIVPQEEPSSPNKKLFSAFGTQKDQTLTYIQPLGGDGEDDIDLEDCANNEQILKRRRHKKKSTKKEDFISKISLIKNDKMKISKIDKSDYKVVEEPIEEENDNSSKSRREDRKKSSRFNFGQRHKTSTFKSITSVNDDDNNLEDGNSRTITSAGQNIQKKYYAFEDALSKKLVKRELIWLIFLYISSLLMLLSLSIYLQSTLYLTNKEFIGGIEMITYFNKHFMVYQNFYNFLLLEILFVDKVLPIDVFSRYNFTKESASYPNATNYADFGYDLKNLSTFTHARINEGYLLMDKTMEDYDNILKSIQWSKEIIFNYTVTLRRPEVQGTSDIVNMTIYNGYMLYGSTTLYETTKCPAIIMSKSTTSLKLRYFLENALDEVPLAVEGYSDTILDFANLTYSSFIKMVLISLLSMGIITILLTLISLKCLWNIRRNFATVYGSYEHLNQSELDERTSQLSKVSYLMDRFKSSTFSESYLGVRLIERNPSMNVSREKRKNIKFTQSLYMYELVSSMIFILIFYIIQISLLGFLVLVFQIKVNGAAWIVQKQRSFNKVSRGQMIGYNMILQLMALGEGSRALEMPILPAFKQHQLTLRSLANTFQSIFEDSSSNRYEYLNQELEDHKEQNICQHLGKYYEMCDLLDSSIPSKGMVQGFYRVYNYLDEVFSIVNTGSYKVSNFVADPKFIEWVYTFNMLYLQSFEVNNLFFKDAATKFVNEEVIQSINQVMIIIILFMVLSLSFIYFSFWNMLKQDRKVAFSFQLISISSVIQNTQIKYTFKTLLRLKKKLL